MKQTLRNLLVPCSASLSLGAAFPLPAGAQDIQSRSMLQTDQQFLGLNSMMFAPGTRRHIQAALKLGVTPEEIMEVLKICVAQGMQSSNLGVPILAEELQRAQPNETK